MKAATGETPDLGASTFEAVGDGRYRMTWPLFGIVFDVDRLRRDKQALVGELTVRCEIPGAKTVGADGVLNIADFNFSSQSARDQRAKLLAHRSNAGDFDWFGLLERYVGHVLAAERTGSPAISLRDVQPPGEFDADLDVEGIHLPRRHPSILFGDGGAMKSYLALYVAGQLIREGFRVGLFDWELGAEDHRVRLERLFGPDMPDVRYVRCERPLTVEVDRLKRIAEVEGLDYIVYDSIAFACDGPPESAEIASGYFRAVRQIGPGSLHIAHITKGENGDQKPFGSAFWYNGARAVWFTKRSEGSLDGRSVSMALYPRKANLGPLRPAVGVEFTFEQDRTFIRRADVADIQELAVGLSLRQRIAHLLREGALPIASIAEHLGARPNSVEVAISRQVRAGKQFAKVLSSDGVVRFGLLEDRRSA